MPPDYDSWTVPRRITRHAVWPPVTALALNEILEESLAAGPSATLITPEPDPRHAKPVHIQRVQALAKQGNAEQGGQHG